MCNYGCCCLLSIFLCIIIPISFQYVQYNEFGFKKNTTTNQVDSDNVIDPGRYSFGPQIRMVTFNRQYQLGGFSEDSALRVFNEEGLEIAVEVFFHYRITEENVQNLMQSYGVNFESKLLSIAESTLKNHAVNYQVREYINNRTTIADTFNHELRQELAEIFIDLEMYKLNLGLITLPQAQQTKLMDDAVVRQNAQKSSFEQQARVVRDETDRDTQAIAANATFINREAAARASRIVEEGQAEANEILAKAYGAGWVEAMDGLGITLQADRAEFLRFMGILDNPGEPQLIDKELANVLVEVSA